MNESFLPHFTLFADTMREMGYVHYIHHQQLLPAVTDTAVPQSTSLPTDHHTTSVVAADGNDIVISEKLIEQQSSEVAVVPG